MCEVQCLTVGIRMYEKLFPILEVEVVMVGLTEEHELVDQWR